MIEFMLIVWGILIIAVVVFVFVVMAIKGTKTAMAIDERVAEKIRKKRKGGDKE